MAEIKEGNTVVLKSGGPTMTIKSIFNDDGVPTAMCIWFDKDEKPQQMPYSLNVLEPDDGAPLA